jgi:predicted house-cleaning noncanonical NTP pyrophosphatase (MazG superfamily)
MNIDLIYKHKSKEKKTVEQLFIKLQEEIGELAVDYLSLIGAKGTNKSRKYLENNYSEEIADAIIILVLMGAKRGITKEALAKSLSKKTNKWIAKQKKTS